MYESDRGIPLVYHGKASVPVLTVENYLKWYTLYLVRPDGSVEAVEFPEDGYCDHVPEPAAVSRMAADNGWSVCRESMEMIIGRYMTETKDYEIEMFGRDTAAWPAWQNLHERWMRTNEV